MSCVRFHPLVSFPSEVGHHSTLRCYFGGEKRNLSWMPFQPTEQQKSDLICCPLSPNASQVSIFNPPDHISTALLDVVEGYSGLTVH
jgi:hypothetical protein